MNRMQKRLRDSTMILLRLVISLAVLLSTVGCSHDLMSVDPSGITSKAASWGHFKTGQL